MYILTTINAPPTASMLRACELISENSPNSDISASIIYALIIKYTTPTTTARVLKRFNIIIMPIMNKVIATGLSKLEVDTQ